MSRRKTHNKTNIILGRISDYYGFKYDIDIAGYFGVAESTVSSWRVRDSINKTLLRAKCGDENLANWFINGIPMPLKKSEMAVAVNGGVAEAPPAALSYSPSRQFNESTRLDYIQKTSKILESPTIFSVALKSNIEAFHEAVITREEIISLRAIVRQHEDRFTTQDRIIREQGELLNQLKDRLSPEKESSSG